jgi:hypothetical protein
LTLPFNITDPDAWPSIERDIKRERDRRIEGLLTVSPDALVGQQQFIAALDWVLELGQPKPPRDDRPIYDDMEPGDDD